MDRVKNMLGQFPYPVAFAVSVSIYFTAVVVAVDKGAVILQKISCIDINMVTPINCPSGR